MSHSPNRYPNSPSTPGVTPTAVVKAKRRNGRNQRKAFRIVHSPTSYPASATSVRRHLSWRASHPRRRSQRCCKCRCFCWTRYRRRGSRRRRWWTRCRSRRGRCSDTLTRWWRWRRRRVSGAVVLEVLHVNIASSAHHLSAICHPELTTKCHFRSLSVLRSAPAGPARAQVAGNSEIEGLVISCYLLYLQPLYSSTHHPDSQDV